MNEESKEPILPALQTVLGELDTGQVLLADPSVSPPPKVNHPACWRLLTTVSGQRTSVVSMSGQAVETRHAPGTVVVAMPHAWAHAVRPFSARVLGVLFRAEYIRFFLLGHQPQSPTPFPAAWWHLSWAAAERSAAILHGLQAITQPKGKPRPLRLLTHALLYQLQEDLATASEVLPGKARHTWHMVQEYLRANLHEPITREDVARALRLHPNHLSRLAREQQGESFHRYLTQLRLYQARQLLRDPRLTVSEIGARCGFGSAGLFVRLFRKYFGLPPGRYRQTGGTDTTDLHRL